MSLKIVNILKYCMSNLLLMFYCTVFWAHHSLRLIKRRFFLLISSLSQCAILMFYKKICYFSYAVYNDKVT